MYWDVNIMMKNIFMKEFPFSLTYTNVGNTQLQCHPLNDTYKSIKYIDKEIDTINFVSYHFVIYVSHPGRKLTSLIMPFDIL